LLYATEKKQENHAVRYRASATYLGVCILLSFHNKVNMS